MRRSAQWRLWLAACCGAVLWLSAAPARAASGLPPARGQSDHLSINLQDADIHHVLRLLAEKSRLNFVVAEDVTGKLTLRLRNVKWTEALKVVLASKSLGMEQEGSIVRIAPLARLQEEAAMRERIRKLEVGNRPLKTRIVQVNYARAEDMAQQVKATLSERGSVTVDARTNSLIIRDVD
jgi:type IV pilus assembly protein PilQ